MSTWPYYTVRRQKLRKLKLQLYPLCESCLQWGTIEAAVAVDHKKPISAGGLAFPPLEGLASLCDRCHNTKTRSEQLGEKNWFRKGCDIFGRPLDPNHPWNEERGKA